MATPQRPVRPVPDKPSPSRKPAGDKSVNKSRAFSPSLNPTVNISVQKGGQGEASGEQQSKPGEKGAPGGDFLSNEDIRAYCEHGRKLARKAALQRTLDAGALEERLRNIPDTSGSMSGARARARRVSRWLKRIAQAEKLIAKWYVALYGAFEREFEAELVQIGRGRHQQKKTARFQWR